MVYYFCHSVIVCLCMHVLVKILFWIALWPFLGERHCPFGFLLLVLIVVPLLKVRPSFLLVSWTEGIR